MWYKENKELKKFLKLRFANYSNFRLYYNAITISEKEAIENTMEFKWYLLQKEFWKMIKLILEKIFNIYENIRNNNRSK